MISHSSRRDSGSTPTVGSSSSSSVGEPIKVQARPSFCFIPPDKWPARRWVNDARSVICRSSRIARRALVVGDAVQTGVEVEVFLDAQIFVEAEPLRHVGDAVLDPLRLAARHRCP